MRILIAPDKFKGSLSAHEVAENIAAGLRDVLPNAKIDIVPMADGGEGTAEVICDALGGSWVKCQAHDPLGREIEARYAFIDNRKLAVMEMSEAAGMRRLQPNEQDVAEPGEARQLLQQKADAGRGDATRRSWATQLIDPTGCPPGATRVDLASTFGVGEMLLDAARQGANEIIVGLGGSATNDGGFGMARAFGYRFFEHEQRRELDCLKQSSSPGPEKELAGVVSELVKLVRIEKPTGLSLPKIVAAADVRNPLLGENGATRIFGPQKGVTPDKRDMFERALARLADVVARDLQVDLRNEPGAGAAGGLGFGLMSFCGATIRPGFEVVAEAAGLETKMKDVDLVITGEGSLDRQTLEGKTPASVARLARKLGKRIVAIVGRASEDRQVRELFDGIYGLGGSIPQARELLRARARELGRDLKKTFNV
jgi:glycerate kinase